MDDNEVEVIVSSHHKEFQVDKDKIQTLVCFIFAQLHLDFVEIFVKFVNNREIQSMNQQFRGIDGATDVLSFPQHEWIKKPSLLSKGHIRSQVGEGLIRTHLGDMIISPEAARKNANVIGHNLDREICFLLVHGILHLCGYDHQNKEDESLMLTLQKSIMTRFHSLPRLWKNCVQFYESYS